MKKIETKKQKNFENWKYKFDIIVALLLMCIFFPIMLVTAAVILIFDGRPIIYEQQRVGKDMKIFRLYKFRTMVHGAHSVRDGLQVQACDPRITKLGRILRKSSLDELPQLINILTGDLSLVGPRACLPEQIPYLNSKHRTRFNVKPGITGLAAIKGRASIPWSRRLRWDRVYVKHRSLYMDICIIIKTIFVVLSGRNVYYDQTRYGPAFDLASPENLPQYGDMGREK